MLFMSQFYDILKTQQTFSHAWLSKNLKIIKGYFPIVAKNPEPYIGKYYINFPARKKAIVGSLLK